MTVWFELRGRIPVRPGAPAYAVGPTAVNANRLAGDEVGVFDGRTKGIFPRLAMVLIPDENLDIGKDALGRTVATIKGFKPST
jgi:hypothetical protein